MGRPWLSLIGRPVAGAMFSLAELEAEGREYRRVHVFDRRGTSGALGPIGVGLADGQSAAQASAGECQAVAAGPVVAAARQVDLGRAAKLAAAKDDGSIEPISPLEVAQECSERGVEHLDMRCLDGVVVDV